MCNSKQMNLQLPFKTVSRFQWSNACRKTVPCCGTSNREGPRSKPCSGSRDVEMSECSRPQMRSSSDFIGWCCYRSHCCANFTVVSELCSVTCDMFVIRSQSATRGHHSSLLFPRHSYNCASAKHYLLWACHSSVEQSKVRIWDPLFHSNVLLKDLTWKKRKFPLISIMITSAHHFYIIHSTSIIMLLLFLNEGIY